MGRYPYAKDKRSDKDFKHYIEVGLANQQTFLDGLKRDFGMTSIVCRENKFGVVDAYLPDAFVLGRHGWFLTEIKVTFRNITTSLDLKSNQIDKLADMKGMLLYSNANWFGICDAETIIEKGAKEFSNRLNKECYIVSKDIFKWYKFKSPLNLQEY